MPHQGLFSWPLLARHDQLIWVLLVVDKVPTGSCFAGQCVQAMINSFCAISSRFRPKGVLGNHNHIDLYSNSFSPYSAESCVVQDGGIGVQ